MDSNRVTGMLFGVAIGDALGAPYEFAIGKNLSFDGSIVHWTRVPSRFHGEKKLPPGQVTDDTEMTIVLGTSLVTHGRYIRDEVVKAYQAWAQTTSIIGKNTRNLFKTVKSLDGYRKHWRSQFEGTEPSTWSLGNGTLMRASPLALLPESQVSDATLTDCIISNPHTTSQDCSIVYVNVLRLLLLGSSIEQVREILPTLPQTDVVALAVDQALRGVKRDINKDKGRVDNTLWCGLYALLHADSYRDGIEWAINGNIMSDTDTNAAVAGAALGARFGYESMYSDKKVFANLEKILNADTSTGSVPRPAEYRPAVIPKLAELLMKLK